LRERQLADGTWDEPYHTGTGFPRDFYINYHLYRHLFPLTALAYDRALGRDQSQREGGRTVLTTESVAS
jgi:squalene-hopene/tetraprenyl-beta-curcumene cyclase